MIWVAVEVDVADMVVVEEVAVVVTEEDMEVAREDTAHKVDMMEAAVDMVARAVDMVEAVVAMVEAVEDMVARVLEDMAALDLKDHGVLVVAVVKTSAAVMARAIQVDRAGDRVAMDSDLLRMVVVQEATAAEVVVVAAIKQWCRRLQ